MLIAHGTTCLSTVLHGQHSDLKLLGDFADSLESIIGSRVRAFIGVNQQRKPPVLLLDLS